MSIRGFLARAVPWPTAERPGYIDIHWTNRDATTGAFKGLGGNAYTSHLDASNFVFGMTHNPVDLYVCMSLQAEAEPLSFSRSGKPRRRAMRSWNGALMLRSHWVDVDVKPGFFPTTADALLAFNTWRVKVHMPEPTFRVMTGSGGFHVHWVYDEPIPREAWLTTAHALQQALKVEQFPCDYGVVVNPACILRIPGTKNHKLAPPGDVVLDQALPFTYPSAFIDGQMAPYRVAYALPVTTAAIRQTLAFKPNPKLANLTAGPRLDAGVEAYVPTLEDVADQCPFIAVTMANHGKGYSEPLWAESLKIVSFVEQGGEAAHELSDGHDDYDEADTDEKYARIAAVHGIGRVGWPQCRTINAAGATECTTCPHFLDNRSPLNYAVPSAPPAPAPPQVVTAALVTTLPQLRVPLYSQPNYGYGDLPSKYKYTDDGCIHAEIEVEDAAGNKVPGWEPVFPNPIYDITPHRPTADGLGTYGMSFECQIDAVFRPKVVVKMSDVNDQRNFNAACSAQAGLASEHMPKLRKLLMAFRDQLFARKRVTKNSEALGWSTEEGKSEPNGFCYGPLRYTSAGSFPYAPAEPMMIKKYQPTGSLDVWKQAAALIVDQNRSDLLCPLAAAFGAPLLYWTGISGVVLSIWSSASGVGKTHIMRVAQAVWGNPKTGMSSLNDTANFVNGVVAQLRHLPFFYDELRQEADTKKIVDLIFAMGQGKSKGRMSASAEIKDVQDFSTLMTVASNNSLMNYINEHMPTTPAGINRIFELEIRPAPGAPGLIDSTVAQQINGSLDHNFGHAGAIYAGYLGRNIPAVKAAVARATAAFNTTLKADHDERFWVTMVAVLVMGAKYANHLGLTRIDENKLTSYLIERFYENRLYRKGAPVDMALASNTTRYLQDFVNSRRDGMLVTDVVWMQATKPPPTFKAIATPQSLQLDTKNICIRLATTSRILRVSLSNFGTWLKKERHVQREVIIDALIKTVGARKTKARIGSHVEAFKSSAREDVLEFDLANLPGMFD